MIRPVIDARLARLDRRDGQQAAAVFVPQREAVEEIFDRVETDAGKVGGAPRADAFEKLQRRREVHRHSRALWDGECTTRAFRVASGL